VIEAEAQGLYEGSKGEILSRKQNFTAIPYYSWAHRGKGEMMVWLARFQEKARPVPQPTLASQSQVTVSGDKDGFSVNDQREPRNSNQLDLQKPETVSRVEVYWFDDTGRWECRIPESWKVLVKKQGNWEPVSLFVRRL